MPAFVTIGNPQPRYSPNLVGDEASFEKAGFINASPTSAADRNEGISCALTNLTEKFSGGTPRSCINFTTRSRRDISQRKCASGLCRLTLTKKSAICSVKYQPSMEPL